MSLNLEFEAPSWDEIYDMLLALADMIKKDDFLPHVIIGISRGGWPPARIMADLLGNVELANIRVEFYRGVAETKSEPVITQPLSTSVKDKKVLVMDDVADTGRSLKLVREHVLKQNAKEIKIATIYYKPWSIIVPDYYVRVTNRWIIFPWERKETVRSLVERCLKNGLSVNVVKQKLIKSGLDERLVNRFINEVLEEARK